jgi:hypothetical protein
MDTSAYASRSSIVVEQDAATLHALVADVSNMGRWSPVCTGGAYDEDGEWFTGTNAIGDSTWETRCRVVTAEPPREFAFVNYGLDGRAPMVRWGFEFRPVSDAATEVTQTWEVLPTYAEGLGADEEAATQVLDMMKALALSGMPETLAALKSEAERGAT